MASFVERSRSAVDGSDTHLARNDGCSTYRFFARGSTFSSEGVDYAQVITREEARLWERDGWSFRHRDGPDMHTAAPAC